MSIDWSQLYLRHGGKWVALADDEKTILGVGNTPKAALEAARVGGHPEPILVRMPKNLTAFVG